MDCQEDSLIALKGILQSIYENASSSSNNNSLKANQTIKSDKIQQINRFAMKIQQNNDRVAVFCKEEASKKKQLYPQTNSLSIKKIKQLSFSFTKGNYFKTEQLPNYGKLSYLKTPNHLYMFNFAFIPSEQINIVFILTESNIGFILSYIQLCIHYNRFIKLFIPLKLWNKVRQLFDVLFTRNIYEVFENNKIVELFEDDKPTTFEFEGSIIIFIKNIWFWDSYNTFIVLKGSKYVFKGPSISDQDILYTMWRKNIINEQEYARLVDKTINTNVVWESDKTNVCLIKQELIHFLSPSMNHYRTFSQCQLFITLPEDIIDQIFLEGEIISCFQDQIVYKSFTKIDKVYIVLEGEAKLCFQTKQEGKQQILGTSGFFSIQSLFRQLQHQKTTLKVSSKQSLIYSIPLWKFKFIIGHFLEDLRQIYQVDLENYIYPKEIQSFNISKWMVKAMIVDSQKCRNFSSGTTKILKKPGLKISKDIWYKICRQDIRCFLLTAIDNL